MAKKVSKNQRTTRGGANKVMAKIVTAEKKSNGQYRFKDKMVLAEEVPQVLKAART